MGHGKETPRQKMIGMMYLMLTAMLAMNVSAELLNAFALVDGGLSFTTRNYADKNAKVMSKFVEAELLNPQKVTPWREKAEVVHKEAQEIVDFVRSLKYKIVEIAEGKDSPALLPDGEVDSQRLEVTSSTDIPAQVMIMEGNGAKLREMLSAYRTRLLGFLDKVRDASLVTNLETMLDTNNPPPTKDGIEHSWESYRFEHIPLIATLPQLTKVQVDVLNAESDVMSFLLNRVDAGDFKFNKISPVVIPNSDYIMRGGEFRAEVFLAASDTTQRPKVYIGAYDSVRSETSDEWIYTMREGHEKDTIPVSENGRGIYRVSASSNGVVSWGGLIEIIGPDGIPIRKPFRHRYTVAEPSMAVGARKMNVFYLGVDNPIDVSVSGINSDKISVSMSGGTITKSATGYSARPTKEGVCKITITSNENGVSKVVGTKEFRVKSLPDPVASLFGMDSKATEIQKGVLMVAQGMEAQFPKDFDFDMKFQVLGFKVGVTVGGFFSEKISNGAQFTPEQKQLMSSLSSGSQLTITDIRVKGADGKERRLESKVYRIK
ncbi:MAG: gliding motility protein GldM [Bacteroides sp.]